MVRTRMRFSPSRGAVAPHSIPVMRMRGHRDDASSGRRGIARTIQLDNFVKAVGTAATEADRRPRLDLDRPTGSTDALALAPYDPPTRYVTGLR